MLYLMYKARIVQLADLKSERDAARAAMAAKAEAAVGAADPA